MVALGGGASCLLGKLGAEKVCARKNLESENSRLFGHTKPVLAEWDRQARGMRCGRIGRCAQKEQAGKPRLYKKQEEADGYCKAVVP